MFQKPSSRELSATFSLLSRLEIAYLSAARLTSEIIGDVVDQDVVHLDDDLGRLLDVDRRPQLVVEGVVLGVEVPLEVLAIPVVGGLGHVLAPSGPAHQPTMKSVGTRVLGPLVYMLMSTYKWPMFCSFPGEESKKMPESTCWRETWMPISSKFCLLTAWVFWRTGLIEVE